MLKKQVVVAKPSGNSNKSSQQNRQALAQGESNTNSTTKPQPDSNEIENLGDKMKDKQQRNNQTHQQQQQHQLTSKSHPNKEILTEKVKTLMEEASILIEHNQFQEANVFLQQAEDILSSSEQLDRNLVIVVLFNRACAYQGLWKLDKCNKYMDDVISKLEISLQGGIGNDSAFIAAAATSMIPFSPEQLERMSQQIKKQTFLVKCLLQQCAILSQLVLHQKAIEIAKKAIRVLEKIFVTLKAICQNKLKGIEGQFQMSNNSKQEQKIENCNSTPSIISTISSYRISSKQPPIQSMIQTPISSNNEKHLVHEEVLFSNIIPHAALTFLKLFESRSVFNENVGIEGCAILRSARESIYFWRTNPENNEKNMRQELNVPLRSSGVNVGLGNGSGSGSNGGAMNGGGNYCDFDEESRSIVGVPNSLEWIQSFNIGSIMHMTVIDYEEFNLTEDVLFELSKNQLIEKKLFLSICYFTIATEIRFIEIDAQKNNSNSAVGGGNTGNGNSNNSSASATISNSKTQSYELSKQIAYQQSEIYHLKSIEIVCQAVTCYSPYITHLINSYHKHYNSSLDMIEEEGEVSMLSQISHTDEQFSKFLVNHKSTSVMSSSESNILSSNMLSQQSNKIFPLKDLSAMSNFDLLSYSSQITMLPNSHANFSKAFVKPSKEAEAIKQPITVAKTGVNGNIQPSTSQINNNKNTPVATSSSFVESPTINLFESECLTEKRPVSQHVTSSNQFVLSPKQPSLFQQSQPLGQQQQQQQQVNQQTTPQSQQIQTIKVGKNNPLFNKKSPQLDMEVINSNGTLSLSQGAGSTTNKATPLSVTQKQSPSHQEELALSSRNRTIAGKQKENEKLFVIPSQNSPNSFSTQNNSPRLMSAPASIKTTLTNKQNQNAFPHGLIVSTNNKISGRSSSNSPLAVQSSGSPLSPTSSGFNIFNSHSSYLQAQTNNLGTSQSHSNLSKSSLVHSLTQQPQQNTLTSNSSILTGLNQIQQQQKQLQQSSPRGIQNQSQKTLLNNVTTTTTSTTVPLVTQISNNSNTSTSPTPSTKKNNQNLFSNLSTSQLNTANNSNASKLSQNKSTSPQIETLGSQQNFQQLLKVVTSVTALDDNSNKTSIHKGNSTSSSTAAIATTTSQIKSSSSSRAIQPSSPQQNNGINHSNNLQTSPTKTAQKQPSAANATSAASNTTSTVTNAIIMSSTLNSFRSQASPHSSAKPLSSPNGSQSARLSHQLNATSSTTATMIAPSIGNGFQPQQQLQHVNNFHYVPKSIKTEQLSPKGSQSHQLQQQQQQSQHSFLAQFDLLSNIHSNLSNSTRNTHSSPSNNSQQQQQQQQSLIRSQLNPPSSAGPAGSATVQTTTATAPIGKMKQVPKLDFHMISNGITSGNSSQINGTNSSNNSSRSEQENRTFRYLSARETSSQSSGQSQVTQQPITQLLSNSNPQKKLNNFMQKVNE